MLKALASKNSVFCIHLDVKLPLTVYQADDQWAKLCLSGATGQGS